MLHKYPKVTHDRAFRDLQNRRDFWNGTLKVYPCDDPKEKDLILILDMGLKNRSQGSKRPDFYMESLTRLLNMKGVEARVIEGQPRWVHVPNPGKYFSYLLEEVTVASMGKGSHWFLHVETQYL